MSLFSSKQLSEESSFFSESFNFLTVEYIDEDIVLSPQRPITSFLENNFIVFVATKSLLLKSASLTRELPKSITNFNKLNFIKATKKTVHDMNCNFIS